MSDPLSAAAGVLGVITAAAQISKLLVEFSQKTKDAPKQARRIVTEVNDVNMVVTQLQSFLLGLDIPEQSRSCLVQAESLLSALTGCIATLSDLERLLDHFKDENLLLLDRRKWISKESAVETLISRLQIHKTTLTLILNIINGSTMQDVRTTVNRLDISMNDHYQEILGRLRGLETHQSSSDQNPAQPALELRRRSSLLTEGQADPDNASTTRRSSRVFSLAFEQDLAITRVYKKIVFGGSTSSLLKASQ